MIVFKLQVCNAKFLMESIFLNYNFLLNLYVCYSADMEILSNGEET